MLPLATSKNLTILGVLTILGAVVAAGVALFDGDPTTNVNLEFTLATISTGIGMILAKGAQSTGGTVPQTPEAAARVAKGSVHLDLLVVLVLVAGLAACATLKGTSVTVTGDQTCVVYEQGIDIGPWHCKGVCVGGPTPVQLDCQAIPAAQTTVVMAKEPAPVLPNPSGTLLTLEQARRLGLVK